MTTGEAIAHFKYMGNFSALHITNGDRDAFELGIEALERLKEHREDHIDITYRALPSETKK